MSPVLSLPPRSKLVDKPTNPNELIVEAWAQGYLVGSLIIMSFITAANMRRGVLLHKLILLELLLGIWQGFWLFFNAPVYAWWLSIAAIFLNASWSLHNVIAWMKIRPFLSKNISRFFIGTVILAQPYWILEIYANFTYFHGINTLFLKTRPWEALCRDPWWISTTVYLVVVIKTQYEMTATEIVRISPRFAVMLLAMMMGILFIVLDIFAVTGVLKLGGSTGINPFWKLAFVFKCLTDSVVLDDFKMALDRLRAFKISRLGSLSGDMVDSRYGGSNLVSTWEDMERQAKEAQKVHSPDSDYIHSSQFPFKPKKARRSHKDSVVHPDHVHWRNSNEGLEPEDIVPSALGDSPIRPVVNDQNALNARPNSQPNSQLDPPINTQHTSQRHTQRSPQHRFLDDNDMAVEQDYAAAMRQMQRASTASTRRPSDPTRHNRHS